MTLAAYERSVEAYCAGTPATVAPAVASLLDALAGELPGGRVLELGCGPGTDADELERRGRVVDQTGATSRSAPSRRAATPCDPVACSPSP